MESYTKKVDYLWFTYNADKYDYFILNETDETDVTERTYVITISGVENERA